MRLDWFTFHKHQKAKKVLLLLVISGFDKLRPIRIGQWFARRDVVRATGRRYFQTDGASLVQLSLASGN